MSRRRDPESTRRRLLTAAFQEICRKGFQRADLDSVLAGAGLTKGALYHHFQSKRGLGYAVVEEVLAGWIVDRWLRPVTASEDPLATLAELARWGERTISPEGLALGCPLNALAQEMSALDEGFRRRLEAVYEIWRQGLADALAKAQAAGRVRAGVDPSAAAAFIVAAWEGSIGLARTDRNPATLRDCRLGLETYLRSLRP